MRENATLTYKQIKELINKMKYDKGDYYLTENENVTTTTLANKYGGVWEKLDENICLMSSNSDKTSNSNEFVVKKENIQAFNCDDNTHSHSYQKTDRSNWGYNGGASGGEVPDPISTANTSDNTHSHKVGVDSPNSVKLVDIIKRPKLFIFRKVSD